MAKHTTAKELRKGDCFRVWDIVEKRFRPEIFVVVNDSNFVRRRNAASLDRDFRAGFRFWTKVERVDNGYTLSPAQTDRAFEVFAR